MDYLLLIVSSALYSVFMMLGGMLLPFAAGLVAALSAGKREKLFVNPKKAVAASVFYGFASGGGNLLLLIALESLPASVQYPLVTGTTMAFSAFFGLCRKEKLTKRMALSVGLALVASVVVVF